MIESLLIANRGEIACRIIRTCCRLGIRTIAVFSEADADARHVALADVKHCIGPAEAARSYLRPDAILEAALAHGADAIHPGYGFLSEKVELAELCRRSSIVWVGPSPECIAMMGSKIESKIIARRANVSGVPGYHGEDQSSERLHAEAEAIGFPVLIKASSGGGGKGMRRVDHPADFAPALDLVKREGKAAFGDDRVLLEKFIKRPRHIEVQLAGDKHGNVVHLFERECSIQRNYQKIIEEAPAANLSLETRQKLLEAAVRLGNAVGYDSLGTVEFILDADDPEPFFLEMNTRLQVEHPVTEMVTGLDLVELQLRIAAGEPLLLSQADVRIRGWAIEARLNAEDPSAEFRPNVGRVGLYVEPAGEGIRMDSGVGLGTDVTSFYDSMLAKIIAFGSDRQAATRRLGAALDQLMVLGVGTNQIFLRDILRLPKFRDEVLTTQFISEAFPTGWRASDPSARVYAAASAALIIENRRRNATHGGKGSPWLSLAGFRVLASAAGRAKLQVRCGDRSPVILDVTADEDALLIETGDRFVEDVRILPAPGDHRLTVREGHVLSQLCYLVEGSRVGIFEPGCGAFVLEAVPLIEAMANLVKTGESAGGSDVVAPMPGLVTEIPVAVGQFLRKGETAAVVESMKLAMRLVAPMDGAVRAIHFLPGETVAAGARIVGLEPATEQTVA